MSTALGMSILTGCGVPAQFALFNERNQFGQVVRFNNMVDILFVIDTSQSMAAKQGELSNQFGPFVQSLVNGRFDFHIAVTTMDMSSSGSKGDFVGSPKVVTLQTPNAKQAVINNLNQGNSGSDLNRGLETMKSAVNKMDSSNAGFLRDQATFIIIFMSDEDDVSSGNPSDYVSFLNSKKPAFEDGFRGWFAHSIVVPSLTEQCKTYNQFASPGYRFMNLSQNSEGITENICEPNLSSAVTAIKKRILQRFTEFHLDREPIIETISVWVAEKQVTKDEDNGWTYKPEGYTITFHGDAIPEADAMVQVDYKPKTAKQ